MDGDRWWGQVGLTCRQAFTDSTESMNEADDFSTRSSWCISKRSSPKMTFKVEVEKKIIRSQSIFSWNMFLMIVSNFGFYGISWAINQSCAESETHFYVQLFKIRWFLLSLNFGQLWIEIDHVFRKEKYSAWQLKSESIQICWKELGLNCEKKSKFLDII